MREIGVSDLYALLHGLEWTILLVVLSFMFGGIMGLILAAFRVSRFQPLRWVSGLLIQAIQGVPLLALLMFIYFGLPAFLQIQVPSLLAVTAAFAIYSGVYLGEIWRGGIEAIKHAQWEAGASLGLSRLDQVRFIIAPQALRISLPATIGFLVHLIKGTSLASVVGFVELTRAGQYISSATYQQLAAYSAVAVIYFCLCYPLTTWARKLEERLDVAR